MSGEPNQADAARAPPANPYQLTRLAFGNLIRRIVAENEGEGLQQRTFADLTNLRERLTAALNKFQDQHVQALAFGGINEQAFALHERIFLDVCQVAAQAHDAFAARMLELQPAGVNPAAPTVHVEVNASDSRTDRQSGSKFDGDMAQWVSFRDKFVATVHHNDNMAPVVKLERLRKSLSGYAASVVGSRNPTEAGYEGAWQRLCRIFDDQYANTQAIIDTMVNLPKMSVASNEGIRKLVDTVHDAKRKLEVLGEEVHYWDSILINLIVRCLDDQTCGAWELKRGADVPTLAFLCDWLDQVARSLMRNRAERIERAEESTTEQESSDDDGESSAPAHTQMRHEQSSGVVSKSHLPCRQCEGDHPIYKCPEFSGLHIAGKRAMVFRLRLCYNCLREGHGAGKCAGKGCARCPNGPRHNSAICPLGETNA